MKATTVLARVSLHGWLMSERPVSRRQAALGRAYGTWNAFARNRLALVGLGIVVLLVAFLLSLTIPGVRLAGRGPQLEGE